MSLGCDVEVVVVKRGGVLGVVQICRIVIVHRVHREVVLELVFVIQGRVDGGTAHRAVHHDERVTLGVELQGFVLPDTRLLHVLVLVIPIRPSAERVHRGWRVIVRVKRIVPKHQRIHGVVERVLGLVPKSGHRQKREQRHAQHHHAHHARAHRGTPRRGETPDSAQSNGASWLFRTARVLPHKVRR